MFFRFIAAMMIAKRASHSVGDGPIGVSGLLQILQLDHSSTSGVWYESRTRCSTRYLENDFCIGKRTWWTCTLCLPKQFTELAPRLHVLCDRHPTQKSMGIRRGSTATGNNARPFQDPESTFICSLYLKTPSTYTTKQNKYFNLH